MMSSVSRLDLFISQTALRIQTRYGYRLTVAQLSEFLGKAEVHIREIPESELPRVAVNKLGTVFYALDVAKYHCKSAIFPD